MLAGICGNLWDIKILGYIKMSIEVYLLNYKRLKIALNEARSILHDLSRSISVSFNAQTRIAYNLIDQILLFV